MEFATLEIVTDEIKGEEESFDADALLRADEDDSDEYNDDLAGRPHKRKRTRTGATNSELNHSKVTDARIKAEGGEAFMLDEEATSLSHHQSSRVFGTFGRRKFNPELSALWHTNYHKVTVRRARVYLPTTRESLQTSIPTMNSCLRCVRKATATVKFLRDSRRMAAFVMTRSLYLRVSCASALLRPRSSISFCEKVSKNGRWKM